MESGNTQAKLTTYFHAERIIHFYFSQEERLRFLRAFLVTPQKPDRLIVGAQNEDLGFLEAEFRVACRIPAGLMTVRLAGNCHQNVCQVLASAFRCRADGDTKVLIDLGATARVHEIAETESLLTSGFRGVPVVCMTQYDGHRLREAIPVSQLRRHGLVIFRDFYALPVSHRAALDGNSAGQNRRRPTAENGLHESMTLV
ncbi:MAG TPA: hypothetical protein VK699_07025 [Terriglobales bacterium]|jgi:hypothetical protein|nr:hypothetical protein [Terriglobales bacterium]